MKKFARVIIMVGALTWLVACPGPEDQPISAECTKVAEHCRLAPGKIGVCSMNTDNTMYCADHH